jgi:hypothetical protein
MRIPKVLFALFSVCLMALTLTLQSAAQDREAVTMPPAYADLADSLPPRYPISSPTACFRKAWRKPLPLPPS